MTYFWNNLHQVLVIYEMTNTVFHTVRTFLKSNKKKIIKRCNNNTEIHDLFFFYKYKETVDLI